MAELPALYLWTDRYLADTTHLTRAEHGTYLLLLIHLWRAPHQRIPNDPAWIARKMGCSLEVYEAEIQPIIDEFCQCDGNWITQKTLSKVFKERAEMHRKQSDRRKRLKNNKPDPHRGPTTRTRAILESPNGDSPPVGPPTKPSRLPADWAPSEADIDYARKRGFPDNQISDIAANFSEYWTNANPRNAQKRDWTRAWQTWVRKETPRKPVNGSVNNPRGQPVVFGQNAAYDTATGLPPILDEAWTAGASDEPDVQGTRRQADLLGSPAAPVHPAAAARKAR